MSIEPTLLPTSLHQLRPEQKWLTSATTKPGYFKQDLRAYVVMHFYVASQASTMPILCTSDLPKTKMLQRKSSHNNGPSFLLWETSIDHVTEVISQSSRRGRCSLNSCYSNVWLTSLAFRIGALFYWQQCMDGEHKIRWDRLRYFLAQPFLGVTVTNSMCLLLLTLLRLLSDYFWVRFADWWVQTTSNGVIKCKINKAEGPINFSSEPQMQHIASIHFWTSCGIIWKLKWATLKIKSYHHHWVWNCTRQ